jgi:hypothetical protein
MAMFFRQAGALVPGCARLILEIAKMVRFLRPRLEDWALSKWLLQFTLENRMISKF